MTLTLNSLRAMIMTYSQAKAQGQRLVGFEDRMEINGRTDGQTDGSDCITWLANEVILSTFIPIRLFTVHEPNRTSLAVLGCACLPLFSLSSQNGKWKCNMNIDSHFYWKSTNMKNRLTSAELKLPPRKCLHTQRHYRCTRISCTFFWKKTEITTFNRW